MKATRIVFAILCLLVLVKASHGGCVGRPPSTYEGNHGQRVDMSPPFPSCALRNPGQTPSCELQSLLVDLQCLDLLLQLLLHEAKIGDGELKLLGLLLQRIIVALVAVLGVLG